ncbi:MAG: hypothetical protein Q4C50_05140 [Eubacteriales bacterium]|nr:hypothetical protein [Eubacteriales bacterium]
MKWKAINEKKFRKKAAAGGCIFLICGFLICMAGFSMAHFNIDQLQADTEPKWYQTVHFDDGAFSLGILLRDGYLTGFSTK